MTKLQLLKPVLLALALLQSSAPAGADMGNQLVSIRAPQEEPPSDASGLHQRARDYFTQGKAELALEDLNAAIGVNPYYTQAYFLRGQIYAARKDFPLAIQDFDKAVEQDNSFAGAFHQRALAHQASRDYRQALKDFSQAMALEPYNALALRDRAMAHRDAGNYDDAVADYDDAMRLGLSAIDPYPMGNLLFFQGRFFQSAQTLQQVVRSKPELPHAALWRYLALAKANDNRTAARELAEQTAQLAVEKPWPAPVFDYYLGKIDESALYAAAAMADDIVKNEQQCQAHFYVAEAKLIKGANDDAIAQLKTAKSQCPPDSAFFHGANAELQRFGL